LNVISYTLFCLQSTADLVAAEIAAISSSADLSSREKNRAKRRAKILAKQRSKENNSPVPGNSSKYVVLWEEICKEKYLSFE
jgi:hypothetical protein